MSNASRLHPTNPTWQVDGALRAAGVNVSVYNLPLCLLDRSVWNVAVQSISDWKNAYLRVCDECGVRDRCSGFFSTGRPRISRGIRPISN
jgi:hypothetical protein